MYGYVFSWIGILVASFMAGAAGGALLITRVLGQIKNHSKVFKITELAIIGFSIAFPLVFLTVPTYPGDAEAFFFNGLFLTLSFISGIFNRLAIPPVE